MPRPAPACQRGMLLPALLVLLALGGLGWLLARQDSPAERAARALVREMQTARALGIAREALLGFAATYRNQEHPNADFGYLPCPDLDGDGSAETCGNQAHTSIGRLPYLTLNLPDLRDGAGECLWYAVAGSFKNNPKADIVNWDSSGRFRLVTGEGRVIALAGDQAGLAAALVIAPGAPRAEQARSPGPGRCGGDPEARQLQQYVEAFGNLGGSDGGSGILEVRSDGTDGNDRIVALTGGDIYRQLKRRSSYAAHLGNVLHAVVDCLERAGLPAPVAAEQYGGSELGRLPGWEHLTGACRDAALRDPVGNWGELMRYARCTDLSDCLVMRSGRCRGALFFGGERLAGAQPRLSPSDKAALDHYLEPATLSALAAGQLAALPAEPSFPPGSHPPPAAADLALCLR